MLNMNTKSSESDDSELFIFCRAEHQINEVMIFATPLTAMMP